MKQSKPKLEHRNRGQVYLGVVDLDKLIEAGHPARAVWALLEGMDFSRWEEQIRSREGEAGRSAVPPRLLAALWIYGYSLGVGSARALERMQSHEPGLRWLCADEPVNHHTLSDFRVRYEEALDGLFSQVLAVLEQGGLVDLGTVVVDGTKVRAASGAGSLHRRATLEESLRQAEEVVEALKRETGEAGGEERRRAAAERAARERVGESAGARAAAGGELGAGGAGEHERAGGADDADGRAALSSSCWKGQAPPSSVTFFLSQRLYFRRHLT